MGIRNLYTRLTPHARPETFGCDPRNAAAERTPLYIDGPALCHHVYHQLFCAATATAAATANVNAFECVAGYGVFALAFGSYLARLQSCGFEMYLPSLSLPFLSSTTGNGMG